MIPLKSSTAEFINERRERMILFFAPFIYARKLEMKYYLTDLDMQTFTGSSEILMKSEAACKWTAEHLNAITDSLVFWSCVVIF